MLSRSEVFNLYHVAIRPKASNCAVQGAGFWVIGNEAIFGRQRFKRAPDDQYYQRGSPFVVFAGLEIAFVTWESYGRRCIVPIVVGAPRGHSYFFFFFVKFRPRTTVRLFMLATLGVIVWRYVKEGVAIQY